MYGGHALGSSVQQIVAKQVVMMSRQNPGFGIAGPAHKLPHEQPVEDDKELPGPGKYETNTSEIARANGHNSSFKLPVSACRARARGVAVRRWHQQRHDPHGCVLCGHRDGLRACVWCVRVASATATA